MGQPGQASAPNHSLLVFRQSSQMPSHARASTGMLTAPVMGCSPKLWCTGMALQFPASPEPQPLGPPAAHLLVEEALVHEHGQEVAVLRVHLETPKPKP